jgi:hypothetical protein
MADITLDGGLFRHRLTLFRLSRTTLLGDNVIACILLQGKAVGEAKGFISVNTKEIGPEVLRIGQRRPSGGMHFQAGAEHGSRSTSNLLVHWTRPAGRVHDWLWCPTLASPVTMAVIGSTKDGLREITVY